MASSSALRLLRQQFIAAVVSRHRYWRSVRISFPRLNVRRVREQGMHERHQERFDGVEFSRGYGVVAREIVDDAPCMAVV